MKIKVLCIMCLCIFILGNIASAEEVENIIRAKIAVQIRSEAKSRLARSTDRVKEKEQIAIYVQPEPNPAYIYLLYSNDQQKVSWLIQGVQYKVVINKILRIPEKAFFNIDGESKSEEIIIVCSPTELPELESLLKTEDLSYEKWSEYKQQLVAQSQIVQIDTFEKPLNIAGTARNAFKKPLSPPPPPFWQEHEGKIKIFSGKSLVVTNYKFEVVNK